MKRLHVHVSVDDIDRAVPFYRALFGAQKDWTIQDWELLSLLRDGNLYTEELEGLRNLVELAHAEHPGER